MRGDSTWLGRRLAILTDRMNFVARGVSYLAWRAVAAPKSGRPTRRRHSDCMQSRVVARLILGEGMRTWGKLKSQDLERNDGGVIIAIECLGLSSWALLFCLLWWSKLLHT
jgi:hypothetical protein